MWTTLKSLLNLLQDFLCFMLWFFGHEACGTLAPTSSALEHEVSTTGLPGIARLSRYSEPNAPPHKLHIGYL